ncbi:MAG: Rrf2 family transcriptional regulator [Geminicoccaceae bacterium]|nr:MAG: Rrf2 family transcriptional regulator [Geminicoccaceae bacterium]
MHLNTFTNYAIRLLMYCALKGDDIAKTRDVAAAYGISENHLTKVAQQLAAAGFIKTLRGRGGGLRLAKRPEDISIGAVVRATEGNLCLVECFDPATNTCPLAGVCRFNHALRRALDGFFLVLDGYTLADLVVEPQRLRPILGLDPMAQPVTT